MAGHLETYALRNMAQAVRQPRACHRSRDRARHHMPSLQNHTNLFHLLWLEWKDLIRFHAELC